MDFTNRNNQQANTPNQMPNNSFNPNPVANNHSAKKSTRTNKLNIQKIGTLFIGLILTLLLVSVILLVSFSKPTSESGYVNTSKLQAVFLNTGQVYFGNVQTINPAYLVLTNIFYLQSNSSSSSSSSTSSNSNVSLVKLGCELHAPYDQMIINMSSVTFWENLKPSGQVAQAVNKYYKLYPHGQTCSNTPSSSTNSTGSVQNAPSSTTPSTPTSSSTTTKP